MGELILSRVVAQFEQQHIPEPIQQIPRQFTIVGQLSSLNTNEVPNDDDIILCNGMPDGVFAMHREVKLMGPVRNFSEMFSHGALMATPSFQRQHPQIHAIINEEAVCLHQIGASTVVINPGKAYHDVFVRRGIVWHDPKTGLHCIPKRPSTPNTLAFEDRHPHIAFAQGPVAEHMRSLLAASKPWTPGPAGMFARVHKPAHGNLPNVFTM